MRESGCVLIGLVSGAVISWLSWFISPTFVPTLFLIPVGLIAGLLVLRAVAISCVLMLEGKGLESVPVIVVSCIAFVASWLAVALIWAYLHTSVSVH